MADYTKIDFARMGGVYGSSNGSHNHTLIQSLIDNNPSKKIIIGSSQADIVYIDKPLVFPTNVRMQINATLKLTDGVVRPLTQDAATGQKRVYVNNSDGVYVLAQAITQQVAAGVSQEKWGSPERLPLQPRPMLNLSST